MNKIFGIRREDKNKWERRVPITPSYISKLKQEYNLDCVVQPSDIRIFKDEEYINNDASVNEDLTGCNVVFAVKEIPQNFFQNEKTYVFFSHTIKGQSYNMPMLRKLMEKK